MSFPVVSGLNPQEDDARFHEYSKTGDDGPSRAGRLSKTFCGVSITLRVVGGNAESQLGIPLELGIVTG